MAFHYSPNVTTDGLILYMDPINTKSYPGTGLTWSDISGLVHTYNGNIGGTLSSVTYNSTSNSFDTNAIFATQSNNISCGAITFADAGEYTLDFWVKLRTGITTNYSNTIFGNGIPSSSLVTLNTLSGISWQITFISNTGLTQYYWSPINDYDLINNWVNITLVFKSNRNIDFYLNGVYKQTVIPTNTSFYINKIASGYNSGAAPTIYNPLQGSISATKIYNRALKATEVDRNYKALSSRFGLYSI